MNYRLLVDFEVIEFLEMLSHRERLLLRNRFVAIRDEPRTRSDFSEHDDTGRPIDIHICGRFAIKYWEDHADRHVKILEVHLADHPRR